MIDGLTIDHFGQIQFLSFAKISASVDISVLGQNLGLGKNFRFRSKFRFCRIFGLGLKPVFKMM